MVWDTVSHFAGVVLRRFGYLFYILNPYGHSYKKIDEVSDYYKEVYPVFFVTVFIEQAIRHYQNKSLFRYNVTLSNLCHGILMEISKIPFRGAEVFVYAWVYKNYRLIALPWDSPWTYLIAWLLTDLCFYWMHRITHQVSILWAIHETHHTPEDLMFTSPMRNHIFLLPLHWFTYLPLALAIPPTTFLVHYQITIIYQYWLHSEIINKFPAWVEYIFSTPSHHRVHHARNRRYIDKNYGGFLIIWDRMFGTFEEENLDDKPLYGTVKQLESLNPLTIQANHFITVWKNVQKYDNVSDKLSAIFKGPGWTPGYGWLGNLEDVPDPVPKYPKYDPKLSEMCVWYLNIHFSLFGAVYLQFAYSLAFLSKMAVFAIGTYLTIGTFAFGFILDKSHYALPFEILRYIIYFVAERIVYHEMLVFGTIPMFTIYMSRIIFIASVATWMSLNLLENLRTAYKERKAL